jgi:sortase A
MWNRGDSVAAVTTTTTSSSTTTTLPPTTTTTAPLPVPQPSPTDAYANVPITQIGTIEIPKIGLVHPIFEGVWLTVVDHGPGHWPGTAMPGALGNTTFAGHRVTHTHPFLDLDRLAVGDSIIFRMPNGVFTYAVTQTLIVDPNALWIADQTREKTVTLFACNPKHSAAQRIVVKGKLVSAVPAGGAASAGPAPASAASAS